ncbi:Acly, partial [Symbiodinium pilosum]
MPPSKRRKSVLPAGDQDGRAMRGDGRKLAHKFNIFQEISSEDDDGELEKERRGLTVEQILERSPKYADKFLDKVKPLLIDPKVSKVAAGGAFTMLEEPQLMPLLNESSKSVQRHIRKCRTALKQMNWAMTSLLAHKDSPWRGLEVKGSLAEHGCVKLLELMKSGMAVGKFSEVHEEEFAKLMDNLHRLYMDIFERRGQELLKAAIQSELNVIYLLPESGGRFPDGSRVLLQDLAARADLNGKAGKIMAWDFALQRYTVEIEKEEKKKDAEAPANPDMFGLGDVEDEEEDDTEKNQIELAVPKKLMVLPKNVLVDLKPPKGELDRLVKDWNVWRKRPRSVSASQDAEAVAAALGPPLESMANFLQDAAQAVGTGLATGRDGVELIADECRQALSSARNLAAKLLGEEPQEPPKPPPLNEPAPALVPFQGETVSQALKEAAEVAQASIELNK